MFTRKTPLTIVLIWGMVPLIAFGSLPRVGCICADGQHKFFCERNRLGTSRGDCVCCSHGKIAADSKRESATSAGHNACCQSQKRGDCASAALVLGTGRPCHPVLDRPVVLTVAKAPLALDRADHTPLFVAFEPLPLIAAPHAAARHSHGELRPLDLVTTLGVLLI